MISYVIACLANKCFGKQRCLANMCLVGPCARGGGGGAAGAIGGRAPVSSGHLCIRVRGYICSSAYIHILGCIYIYRFIHKHIITCMYMHTYRYIQGIRVCYTYKYAYLHVYMAIYTQMVAHLSRHRCPRTCLLRPAVRSAVGIHVVPQRTYIGIQI